MVVALAFLAMGLGALARPDLVLAQFGVDRLTREGRNEVRAVYGGFGIAVAALLFVPFAVPDLRGPICLTVAVALMGMAAGRLVSAVVDRGMGRIALAYLAVEMVGAAALLAGIVGR